MSDIIEILPGEVIVERAAIRELGPLSVHDFREQRSVVQISFLTAGGTGWQQMTSFAAKMKFEGLTSVSMTAHITLRTGQTITVGFGWVARNANGVGSRFRATTNQVENSLSENDSRPLPQYATVIHLPVLFPRNSSTGNGAIP
jgi:hypothetical protein